MRTWVLGKELVRQWNLRRFLWEVNVFNMCLELEIRVLVHGAELGSFNEDKSMDDFARFAAEPCRITLEACLTVVECLEELFAVLEE